MRIKETESLFRRYKELFESKILSDRALIKLFTKMRSWALAKAEAKAKEEAEAEKEKI